MIEPSIPNPNQNSSKSVTASVYISIKSAFGRMYRHTKRSEESEPEGSLPFTSGRDPRLISSVFSSFVDEMGWSQQLAQAEILQYWDQIVGFENAKHTRPVSIDGSTLIVQCDSTSWATQLRIIKNEVINKILQQFPRGGVDNVRFLGPNVPSWKSGPKSVPGRGPRDTYG